jgi:hypothetical protein
MDLKEIAWECVDWIHLAQDRDKWQASVNMVMTVSRLAECPLASQGLCSMEVVKHYSQK